MKLLFCSDPLQTRKPDSAYEPEASAASALNIPYFLIDFEALMNESDPTKVVRRVLQQTTIELALYRGWMLRPEQYAQLYDTLLSKNIQLINDPTAYKHCHYLPESYSPIEGFTPRSVWTKVTGEVSIDNIMELLQPFGAQPVIVKDFVKSRKHEWADACYIPSASNRVEVERVVRRFLELQGEDLNEGLVFREFVEFEPLAQHSKSNMPLTKEFRLFFLDQTPVYWAAYWEEGDYQGIQPPIDQFQEIAKRIQSRFFTMDVARRIDGKWLIVELGDAQVAGLPDNAHVPAFYKALSDTWPLF